MCPSSPERSKSIVDAVNVPKICGIEAAAPPAVPRVIPITRADRQPADAPKPEPKSESDTKAAASKAEERDVRRRPDWTVSRISYDRPRPPNPIAPINEPAAVVVGRPSPRLVRYPGPAVVGLINPRTGAIWRPARRYRWSPNLTVVGDFCPLSMAVEIFRARVVAIRVLPAPGGGDRPVAVFVPLVPIIRSPSGIDAVLWIVGALDCDHLPAFHASAALRSRDISRAPADDHHRFRIRIHLNAVLAFSRRMDP